MGHCVVMALIAAPASFRRGLSKACVAAPPPPTTRVVTPSASHMHACTVYDASRGIVSSLSAAFHLPLFHLLLFHPLSTVCSPASSEADAPVASLLHSFGSSLTSAPRRRWVHRRRRELRQPWGSGPSLRPAALPIQRALAATSEPRVCRPTGPQSKRRSRRV